MNKYPCAKCGGQLRHTSKLMLTSYPIGWVLECPNCDITYFLLVDGVLCAEQDFNERIYEHYKI